MQLVILSSDPSAHARFVIRFGAGDYAPNSLPSSLPSEMPDSARASAKSLLARSRHAQRVRAAKLAALWAAGHVVDPSFSPECETNMFDTYLAELLRCSDALALEGRSARLAAVAVLLLDAELHGAGGPAGLGGPERGTARAWWASELGSGRSKAGDGAAWDVALEEAREQLARAVGQGRHDPCSGDFTISMRGGCMDLTLAGVSLLGGDDHEEVYLDPCMYPLFATWYLHAATPDLPGVPFPRRWLRGDAQVKAPALARALETIEVLEAPAAALEVAA